MMWLISWIITVLTGGPFIKSDGGEDCVAFVSWAQNLVEGMFYGCLFIAVRLHYQRGSNRQPKTELLRVTNKRKCLDVLLGCILLAVYAGEVFFKLQTHKALLLLNPCHVITLAHIIILFKGDCLLSSRLFTAILVVQHMPLMACFVADLHGRATAIEVAIYYAQHVLIAFVVPLYIMVSRRSTYAYKHSAGLWFYNASWQVYHWVILFPVAMTTHINLNFSLCPIDASEQLGMYYRLITLAVLWPVNMLGCRAYMKIGDTIGRCI
jgi:hypothetical protein